MPLNTRKKRLILVILLILLCGVFFLPLIYLLSDKLSKTSRVNANILVVEGWLPPYAIQMAFDEFKNNGYGFIITTGLKDIPDYFNVFTNGYLVFKPFDKLQSESTVEDHTIKVKAFSSLGGGNRAEFNILVNGVVVGYFKACKAKKYFKVIWHGLLSDIDSISIQFLNDRVGTYGDRNLFVKEICIDDFPPINYQLNSVFVFPYNEGRIVIKNNYDSFADLARNSLLSLGLDSSSVISIPGEKVIVNRTLSSALAFSKWLSSNYIEVKGINVVTLGTHAERTWMTYNRILKKKYNIGIVSLPDNKATYSKTYKVMRTLRETIGIAYYSLILIPY